MNMLQMVHSAALRLYSRRVESLESSPKTSIYPDSQHPSETCLCESGQQGSFESKRSTFDPLVPAKHTMALASTALSWPSLVSVSC